MVNVPCGWEALPCATCCTDELEALDPAVRDVLADAAVGILWALSGKQYGLCEVTLRPCRRECGSFWGGLPTPYRIGGEWVNVSCGSCAGSCGCSVLSEFLAEDTYSIEAITVDGEDLDPLSAAVVYDYRRIVRVDGGQWPTCQNLGATTDEEGTWSVTVLKGKPVPAGGEIMAGILLCELAKACAGSDDCRLPRRIQNITRQGVSINFQDVFASIGEGRTGLMEVDLWLIGANADDTVAQITSPDLPTPSVMTWPLPEESV